MSTPNLSNAPAATSVDEDSPKLNISLAGPVIAGMVILAVFFGGFGVWGFTAPINGATIASGAVAASGLNLKVKHLEGGVIEQIVVHEGDQILRGEPLVVLDRTIAAANRNRVIKQLTAMKARLARNLAERAGLTEIHFDPSLNHAAVEENLIDLLEEQEAEFTNRLKRHQSELSIVDQRVKAIEQEIQGLSVQRTAVERQLEVVQDDLLRKATLLERGLTTRNEYNQLLRSEADLIGRIGSLTAGMGQKANERVEAREKQNHTDAQRIETASGELNQTRAQIADLQEQLYSSDNVLERIIVRAPGDGVVVKLHANTPGGVIGAGETIAEILPTSHDLLVEARISPQDIDVVRVGQDASLRFVALNQRTTPEVPATVSYVSADRLFDEATREPYYIARLRIATTLPDEIRSEQIYPGMPVDAFIKNDERTFVEYLLRPIKDSFNKAFREE